ncbi:MAG: polyphosphate kinase 2 family protein [Bacteroidetes bacterium]|nr:polyphosphate kinase 2 family protein [Bacteroidota bacterium]
MKYDELLFTANKKARKMEDFDAGYTGKYESHKQTKEDLEKNLKKMAQIQDKLYAEGKQSLLIILQALDAAGKDGAIKHVMSGLNPQGCMVSSFKAPSVYELDHDFLWRAHWEMPSRGKIGIFNRSYYEEVLVVRVHQNILKGRKLPDLKEKIEEGRIWQERYDDINNFEMHLERNGMQVLKFFLNVSKKEQKDRFMQRIENPEKNWKLSPNDVKERQYWSDYMKVYFKMLEHTSTKYAPWYIIPADNKWFSRIAIGEIVVEKLKEMHPQYPELTEEQKQALQTAKAILDQE